MADVGVLVSAEVSEPAPAPERSKRFKRIPSLDGLRSLAVLIVCLSHMVSVQQTRHPTKSHIPFLLDRGQLGVMIFFVLSGYLITSLLLHEKKNKGTISLRNFYKRRIIRIVPPFYAFLLVVTIVDICVGLPNFDRKRMIPASVFFLTDYIHQLGWLGHTWSLSMEEQFYMLWPLAVLVLRLRNLKRLAFFVVIIVPVLRYIAILRLPPGTQVHMFFYPYLFMFHNRCDALMIGSLAAIFAEEAGWIEIKRRLFRLQLHWVAVVGIVVEPVLFILMGPRLVFVFGFTMESLMIGAVVLWLIDHHDTYIGRIFNARIPVFLGTASYSIYLWQQLFLRPGNTTFSGYPPQSLFFALAVGLMMFFLIEKPILDYRDRTRTLSTTPRDPSLGT